MIEIVLLTLTILNVIMTKSTVKEAYCSYEIAKLLKEKGFDEKCHSSYWGSSDNVDYTDFPLNYNDNNSSCSRPTHQMAMAWLREVHKVLIVIDAYHADHWEGYIDSFEISIYSHASTIIVPNEIAHHTDYTEAVETAIKYSLEKLI